MVSLKFLSTFLPQKTFALGSLGPTSLLVGDMDLTAWICTLQGAENHAQSNLLAALLLLLWNEIKPGSPILLVAQLWGILSIIFAVLILVSTREEALGRLEWIWGLLDKLSMEIPLVTWLDSGS